MKNDNYTKAIVVTGLLIAVSIVLRSTGIMVPIAGAAAMRISLDRVFYVLPGLIFGPLFGGIAAGITDILAFIIHPSGAFIPLMTVTTIMAGFTPALIWRWIKDVKSSKLQISYIASFLVIGLIGVANHIMLVSYSNSAFTKRILSLGKKAQFIGVGLEIIALIGFTLLIINYIIKAKSHNEDIYNYYLKLVITLGIPILIVSTINTFLLRMYIPGLAGKAFAILWVPRIAESLLMIPIEAYITSLLLVVYNKLR